MQKVLRLTSVLSCKKLIVLIVSILFVYPAISQNLGYSWLKTIKGLSATYNYGTNIKLDASGNIYLLGRMTTTCDFDPSPATYTLTTLGVCPFIAKYDPIGNLIWAKQFNDPYSAAPHVVGSDFCLDNLGNVYLVGGFKNKVDFDPGPNTYTLDATNGESFACKLDNAGNFTWAVQFGRDSSGGPTAIELDNLGNPIILGVFQKANNDFDPGPNVYNLSALGTNDAFILKLTASGSFNWVKHLGGIGSSVNLNSAVIDNVGNIVVSGGFNGICDFDPSSSTFNMNGQNGYAFISRYNSNGNHLNAWQLANGGGFVDHISCDANGNIIATFGFNGTGDFDPGINTLLFTPNGPYDIAVCKFTSNGALVWGKQISGSFTERAFALQVTSNSEVIIGGQFQGTLNANPGPGTYTLASIPGPNSDAYLIKLNVNGDFVWAKQFSGPWHKRINNFALNSIGEVFATGFGQEGSDFDPGKGSACSHTMSALYYDPYILKLSPCQAPAAPVVNPTVATWCGPSAFTLNATTANNLTWRTQLMSNTYIDSVATHTTSVLAPGNYTYYAAAWNCCAESFPPAQINVSVFPIPTISLVASKDTFCLGEPVILTALGGVSYVMGTTFSSGNFTVWPTQNTTYTVNGGDIHNCNDTASIQLIYDPCTAINSYHLDKQITLWPNPTNEQLHLRIEQNGNYTLTVVDVLGRIVLQKNIYSEAEQVHVLKLENKGVYEVIISNANARVAKKVVVE